MASTSVVKCPVLAQLALICFVLTVPGSYISIVHSHASLFNTNTVINHRSFRS